MKRFADYSNVLNEALSSPVEYYMTDDTVLPTSIYAAFTIDGNKYVMAFVQSNAKNTYVMEVGKTSEAGGKVMWWRFHKPGDLIQVLSTAVKFAESAMFVLGPNVKAFALKFRPTVAGSVGVAERIVEKLVKRSYIKTMTYVAVKQPEVDPGTHWYHKERFIFVVRKNQPLTGLFKGPEFNKYAGSEDANIVKNGIDAEIVAAIKPKKVVKQSVDTTPSTKYTFGKFDVDVSDPKLIDKIRNVKPAASSQPAEKPIEHFTKVYAQTAADFIAVMETIPALSSLINSVKKYGYDEKKFNINNLEYVTTTLPVEQKDLLTHIGLLSSITGKPRPDEFKHAMEKIGSVKPNENTKANAQKYLQTHPNVTGANKSTNSSSNKQISNFPVESLVATLPGSGTSTQFKGGTWAVEGFNLSQVETHLNQDLGYYEDVQKISGFSTLVSYSGSQYTSFNNPLRAVIGKLLNPEHQSYYTDYTPDQVIAGKIMTLAKMFDKVKPLPESMWVYRGTSIPAESKKNIVPGYEYVDPAFMSTSIKPDISFGYDRMRIFLPKGSKVIPILNNSSHKNEKEILLPASSVIKILEVEKINGQAAMTGVFTGSAHKSIIDELKKIKNQLTSESSEYIVSLVHRMITEMTKQYDTEEKSHAYNPEDKFGGEYDFELAELIAKAIKDKRFKVEEPSGEK